MQFDIRRFDIYRKVPKDLTQPTLAGACISLCSVAFMTYLFLSELAAFIMPDITSVLYVEDPIGQKERIPVSMDISLPKMKCEYIGLDIQDDLGRHEVGFVDNTEKVPINDENGCRFKADFKINKVPGNFHVSTHASRKQPENPDMTHTVHKVSFGHEVKHIALPGSFNPLLNHDKTENNALSSHDYYMKVVPTVYEDISGNIAYPYQYTFGARDYMQYGHGHKVMPAIWFRFDISPITVKYAEKRKPLYHFFTTVCAIVGGTFTVAGIIDSVLFTATELFKKFELGKLS